MACLFSNRVKREAFLRELREAGCVFTRHGHRHDIWSTTTWTPSSVSTGNVPSFTAIWSR